MNAVPEAQRPTLLTIFQHECAVRMEKEKQAVEKEKQVTADKEKAAMIEETKKIEATTKLRR